MPSWLVSDSGQLAEAAAKAALMYAVALVGLRLAHRRTLSQWTAIDFAAAIATGAVLGRTAVASGQSFAVGAVALVTLLTAHTLVTLARYHPLLVRAVDHRVRVLVDHGVLRRDQLRICGLTDEEFLAKLRQRGVRRLAELRYVLYETKGDLTIVWETEGEDGELVEGGLREAAGYPPGP